MVTKNKKRTTRNYTRLWKQLFESEPGPSTGDLLMIILSVRELRQKAWQVLKVHASPDDCREIVRNRKSRYPIPARGEKEEYMRIAKEAGEVLLAKGNIDDHLLLMEKVPSLQGKAWEKVKRSPASNLEAVIRRIPNRRDDAWSLLKSRVSPGQLPNLTVIWNTESIREEAWSTFEVDAWNQATPKFLLELLDRNGVDWLKKKIMEKILEDCRLGLIERWGSHSICLALGCIIASAPQLRARAWRFLKPLIEGEDLEKPPLDKDFKKGMLVGLLCFSKSAEISEAAAAQLLKLPGLNNRVLANIVLYAPVPLGEEAWEKLKLFTEAIEERDLIEIVMCGPLKFKEEVAKVLLEREVENSTLHIIIRDVPSLQEEAKQRLQPETDVVMQEILHGDSKSKSPAHTSFPFYGQVFRKPSKRHLT